MRSAGDPWWVAKPPPQTGRFHTSFQATPSKNNIDAVVGLGKGSPSTWSQLATIVRFSPAGVIDVRKGGAYAADVSYRYSANTTYYIRMDIDVPAHTYTVTVSTNPQGGFFTTLAKNYPFRTEQASVTSLDAVAVYVEPTTPGSLQICGLETVADDSTPDGCVTSAAGGRFANAWFDGTSAAMFARFTATPSATNMDGVVGYTLDKADAYNDFAASIRFYTNGQIEARDGTTYRATNPKRYIAGHAYDFYFMIDARTSTYSVYVGDPSDLSSSVLLADNFHFRPEQATVGMINNLATVVSSSTGGVRVCQYRKTSDVLSAQQYATLRASFRDGRVLVSNANGSSIIDSAGHVVLASPALATDSHTFSTVAIDDDGNIYSASVTDTNWWTLNVQSFTSTLQPRWTKTYAVQTGATTIGVYGNGVLGIAADQNGTLINVRTSDGAELRRFDLRAYQPSAVAIGPGRFAFAWRSGNDGVVEVHAVDGTKVWERRWTANFSVAGLVMDRGGDVVFGGSFGEGGVDFGAGHYDPVWSSEVELNGFIVELRSDGTLQFANRIYAASPNALSADGNMIVYGTQEWAGAGPDIQLYTYVNGGEHRYNGYLSLLDSSAGMFGNALAAGDGRILMTATLKAYGPNGEPGFPALVTLLP